MAVELTVPALGESITEAVVGKWHKKVGDTVAVDEPVVVLDDVRTRLTRLVQD